MAAENANYISQLNKLEPTGSQFVSEGDDHLRVIKQAVQQSLPNITGPVTATQAQLNTVTSTESYFPEGGIIMWSGLTTNIPSGWALCDGVGTTANGGAIPDLRGRFVLGAQSQTAVPHGDSTRLGWQQSNKAQLLTGASGGSWASNTNTGTTGGTAITIAQMPAHDHKFFSDNRLVELNTSQSSGNNAGGFDGGQALGATRGVISSGSGQPHTHSMPSVSLSVMNAYLVLAYIIRTGNSFVAGV
tara:strand:- start:88 stop:822 length:735 start_codon:yes stop_codon:yes gene_type:complete